MYLRGETEHGRTIDDVVVLEIDKLDGGAERGRCAGDMGARVVEIEPISEIHARHEPSVKATGLTRHSKTTTFSSMWTIALRSLSLSLDQPEGAALVRQLAQKADIFMCNLLTKRQQKFGLDPDSLFKANPKLVRHPNRVRHQRTRCLATGL